MNQKPTSEVENRCINTIRMLSADAVQKANSGHPGMPMGAAAMAYVLWTRFLRHNPRNPQWFDRDRFVLSAGHGSMLLYSLLHLTGYDLPLEELKHFRQMGQQDARPSRARPYARRRSYHRPAGARFRQRRRHGDRRSLAGGPLQPARPQNRGSLHLRDLRRRRSDGRHHAGSRVAGRASSVWAN